MATATASERRFENLASLKSLLGRSKRASLGMIHPPLFSLNQLPFLESHLFGPVPLILVAKESSTVYLDWWRLTDWKNRLHSGVIRSLIPSQPALPLPRIPTPTAGGHDVHQDNAHIKWPDSRDSKSIMPGHGSAKTKERDEGLRLRKSSEASCPSPTDAPGEDSQTRPSARYELSRSEGRKERSSSTSAIPKISISLDTTPLFATSTMPLVENMVLYQDQRGRHEYGQVKQYASPVPSTRTPSEATRPHRSHTSPLPFDHGNSNSNSSKIKGNSFPFPTVTTDPNSNKRPSEPSLGYDQIHMSSHIVPVSPIQSLSQKPSTSSLASWSSSVYSQSSDDTPAATPETNQGRFSIARKSLPPPHAAAGTGATTIRARSFDASRTDTSDGNGENAVAAPRRSSYEPPPTSPAPVEAGLQGPRKEEFKFGGIHALSRNRAQHPSWHRRAQHIHHRQQQQQQRSNHYYSTVSQRQPEHPKAIPAMGRGCSRLFVYEPRIGPSRPRVTSSPSLSSNSPDLPQLPGLEDYHFPASSAHAHFRLRASSTATTPTASPPILSRSPPSPIPDTVSVNIPMLSIDTAPPSPSPSLRPWPLPLPSSPPPHSHFQSYSSRIYLRSPSPQHSHPPPNHDEAGDKCDGHGESTRRGEESAAAAAAWQTRTRMFQMENPHLRPRPVEAGC
ncbi:hypothetical protein F5Y17DRAFT_455589 [Xylariaceae sp. FL0594]|nr:hypothetical protein F5Y17DRAFT_455589 [Xylariaceae sp. FL0594]